MLYILRGHIASMHALIWHSKSSARVLHIKYPFMFNWDFDNRHNFYDKGTFIGFFKSSTSERLYLEILVTIPRLNFKTVCIDNLLCYISFCFLYSSVLFSQKVTKLPLACHQSLLTWKVDQLSKCILFELLLYGFTHKTEYINLYE